MSIESVVAEQRSFFEKGETKKLEFRLNALQKLRMEIQLRTKDLETALYEDLGKVAYEAYMTEIGLTLEELGYIIKNTKKWAKDKRVKTPLSCWPGKSFVRHEPYGVVLVMAPWNYPVLLSLEPLIGALAAGNCVVLKPSAYAPATSAVLRQLVESCFAPGHVALIEGGRAENTALLEQRFDYIFFTGSVDVGKIVMEKAAQSLTPVSLELGGKSPCIVDATADIKLAGRRIVFGKFLNAGQTCIAPDYLLVHKDVKDSLMQAMKEAVHDFFGENPLSHPELPKIVNERHFNRLVGLMQGLTPVFGGENDGKQKIAPTVLQNVTAQSPIMQEEIFGPLLPVIPFDELGTAISFINEREKPLALYFFSTDEQAQARVLEECSFGGGCINDTILHIATSHMGFGGVGHSGMGSYHGKKSFDTFTHEKSILCRKGKIDIKLRYHPYTQSKNKLLRKILK